MKNRYNNRSNKYKNNYYKTSKKGNLYLNILFLITVFVILTITFNVILAKEELTTKTIIVKQGSTIWDIANDIRDDNLNVNIQNIVLHIKKLNNIENSMIYEGQKLLVYNY